MCVLANHVKTVSFGSWRNPEDAPPLIDNYLGNLCLDIRAKLAHVVIAIAFDLALEIDRDHTTVDRADVSSARRPRCVEAVYALDPVGGMARGVRSAVAACGHTGCHLETPFSRVGSDSVSALVGDENRLCPMPRQILQVHQ